MKSTLSLFIFLMLAACTAAPIPMDETAVPPLATDNTPTETAVAVPTTEPTIVPATATAPPTRQATATIEPTATPTQEPTAAPAIRFTRTSPAEQSILSTVEDGPFANELNGTGAVTYHNGQFHMFYNAIQDGWPPADILIGYATSTDGINWTREGNSPVFVGSETPFDIHTIYAGSVVVAADGTWLLYFHTVTRSTADGEGDAIGVATAPAPTGPWTVHDSLLLMPDPAGWDNYALWAPSVVRTDAGYFMYYSGLGPPPSWDRAVGLATSPDGFNWTRHGPPVFSASETDAWDDHRVEQSVVTTSPDGFVMVYRADKGSGNFSGAQSAFGIAVSSNGVQWERGQALPILEPRDDPMWRTLWSAGLVYRDGTYYLYVETDGPYRGTRLYATTYTGELDK